MEVQQVETNLAVQGARKEGDLASNGFAMAMRVKLPPKPAGH